MEEDDVQSDFSFSFVFPRDDVTGKDSAYCVAVPERALYFENMSPLAFVQTTAYGDKNMSAGVANDSDISRDSDGRKKV
jgi:hypothetical protein